jgi:Family of unknown function (DUF5670)
LGDEKRHLGHRPRLVRAASAFFITLLQEGLMLWTIVGILLVLWLLGVVGHVGGSLIHLLLVVAVVVFLINLVSGRRPV